MRIPIQVRGYWTVFLLRIGTQLEGHNDYDRRSLHQNGTLSSLEMLPDIAEMQTDIVFM